MFKIPSSDLDIRLAPGGSSPSSNDAAKHLAAHYFTFVFLNHVSDDDKIIMFLEWR